MEARGIRTHSKKRAMSSASSYIRKRSSNAENSAVIIEARFVLVSFPCQKVRAFVVFAACAKITHTLRRLRMIFLIDSNATVVE